MTEFLTQDDSKQTGQEQAEKAGSRTRSSTALIEPIRCVNCGADKVVVSQPRYRDLLLMRFLSKRPYRCLHCYHRFWKSESFFASPERVVSWLIVFALIVSLFVLPSWKAKLREKHEPFSDFGSAPNAVPGQPPAELLEPDGTVQPTFTDDLASLSVDLESDDKVEESVDLQSSPVVGDLSAIQPTSEAEALVDRSLVNEEANPAALLEQLYTTKQLQERLRLAKASAEQAKKINQQNQARLQQSIAPEQDELQSLLRVDINFRIDQWRMAWEKGLVEDYLSFYSHQFTPDSEFSRSQWVAQRKQRIQPSKKIDLAMDNFDVVFASDNTMSTVSFDQTYQSGGYVELSRKQLVLRKETQQWKIVSETEVPIGPSEESSKTNEQ